MPRPAQPTPQSNILTRSRPAPKRNAGKSRSDGQLERKNFIVENRKLAHSMTYDALLEQRAATRTLERQKSEGNAVRFREHQEERRLRLEEKAALEQSKMASAAARYERAAGLSPMVAALHAEQTRKWSVLAVLAKGAGLWGEALENSRTNMNSDQRRAAAVIHRAASRKILKGRLKNLRWSMLVLRRNLAIFVKKNKLRRKVSAANTVRAFLEIQKKNIGMKRTVKNFVYNSIRMPRRGPNTLETLRTSRYSPHLRLTPFAPPMSMCWNRRAAHLAHLSPDCLVAARVARAAVRSARAHEAIGRRVSVARGEEGLDGQGGSEAARAGPRELARRPARGAKGRRQKGQGRRQEGGQGR
tara:strand:- start:726 stop:1799 length:1074 start_codon:yes stop_codon:yes gene_type:complete